MNFLLRNLEQNVAEDALVQGEQLFEQSAVLSLRMVERNLWIAKVEQHEVELKISPSKLLAATCECEIYREKGMCQHIVAGVFDLRKTLEEIKSQKPEKKTKKRSNRLTIRSLINEIEEASLKRFVQEYANKDRNFALAFKARFVGQIELSDDKDKYLQILEDTIKAARKKDRTISYRGKQKLIKIAEELLQQSDLAYSQGYYRSAVFIAQSFIEKFTPILRKLNEPKEIRAIINENFQSLHQLLQKQIPPALLEDLWLYSTTEFLKITYRINEVVVQFYQLQMVLAEHLNKQVILLDLLNDFSLQMQYSDENHTQLLIHRISLLEKLQQWEASDDLVKEHLNNPNLLLFVVQQAIKRTDNKQAEYLAKKGLEYNFPINIKANLKDILIQIAQQNGDKKTQAKYSENRLLESYQIKYYEILRGSYKGDWTKKVDNLLNALQKKSYALVQRDLIANIYAEEKRYEELLAYIEQLRSLDILQNFDQQLIKTHASTVYQLYESFLRDYTKHHIGRKAAVRIRTKLAHLYQIGGKKIAKQLLKEFRSNYPERHTLMEELDIFE